MSCMSMTRVPMRTKLVTQLSVMSAIVTRWCTKCCQKSLRFVSNTCASEHAAPMRPTCVYTVLAQVSDVPQYQGHQCCSRCCSNCFCEVLSELLRSAGALATALCRNTAKYTQSAAAAEEAWSKQSSNHTVCADAITQCSSAPET
jgi:hypothetical protein